jgi:hypothetical protein
VKPDTVILDAQVTRDFDFFQVNFFLGKYGAGKTDNQAQKQPTGEKELNRSS